MIFVLHAVLRRWMDGWWCSKSYEMSFREFPRTEGFYGKRRCDAVPESKINGSILLYLPPICQSPTEITLKSSLRMGED